MTLVHLPGPRSKYGAKREGKYASQKESKRAWELHILERAGKIQHLVEQPRYVLIPREPHKREIIYVADFSYVDETGRVVVEDVKGFKTPLYRLKKRLMEKLYGIEVLET